MRRINWKTVSTLIAVITVAGCSEQVLAPMAPTSATSIRFAPAAHPSFSLNAAAPSNGGVDFTVGPNGGVFFVGRNAVIFPKGSICDPSTSSYGFGTWDEPCSPLTTPIQIHAETRKLNGQSWVDFSPSLRFVPSADPSHYVWMYMSTPSAAGRSDLGSYTIYFAPSIGGPRYDEALTDPTLLTYVDTRSGTSIRRIKHFTGYVVSSGIACDASSPSAGSCPSDPSTTP